MKHFALETIDSIKVFGVTFSVLSGHSPGGEMVYQFFIARKGWVKTFQL